MTQVTQVTNMTSGEKRGTESLYYLNQLRREKPMITESKISRASPLTLRTVPPFHEQAGFTMNYKRYAWDATVHIIHTCSKGVIARVSNSQLSESVNLSQLLQHSDGIEYDLNNYFSQTRLIEWAGNNGMHLRRWRQLNDNGVEVIA